MQRSGNPPWLRHRRWICHHHIGGNATIALKGANGSASSGLNTKLSVGSSGYTVTAGSGANPTVSGGEAPKLKDLDPFSTRRRPNPKNWANLLSSPQQKQMPSPPAFLHSSFRVSSTWLWRHFRAAPGTIAYYEIFHERLAKLTPEGIESFTTECWDSRHPSSGPYFTEFRELLNKEGGVRRYNQSFAFDCFVPENGPQGPISPEETEYVASLIAHANTTARIPVLTCSRSLGRVTGLKKAFGGFHIVLVRNLWRQWLSYVSMTNSGTYYFLNATILIILNSRHDDYIQTLCERFVETQTARGDLTIARFSSIDAFLAAFIRLHLYLYAHAALSADLLIYTDDLLADRAALHAVSRLIEDATGIALDLTDIKNFPKPWAGDSGNPAAALYGAVDEVATALDLPPEHRAIRFISKLSTSCASEGGDQTSTEKKNV